jgi:hypothetical protein
MRILLFIVLLFTSFIVNSQKIYSVNSKFDADIKVYVVDSQFDADLLVYKVDSQFDADLKIYFVGSQFDAGWSDSSKKHLLY